MSNKINYRIYIFGGHKVRVCNGNYLDPERIKHYEEEYGRLESVTYKGQTVVNDI